MTKAQTLTLADATKQADAAERAFQRAAAEQARLAAEENDRRDVALGAWAAAAVETYDADMDRARADAQAALDAMTDGLRRGDMNAVVVAWHARVRAQAVEIAVHRRQDGAAYLLPQHHPRYNRPKQSGDNEAAYHHESFGGLVDHLLQQLRAETADAVRAELYADRPEAPDEGYRRPEPPGPKPFKHNKPTSTMTVEEHLAFDKENEGKIMNPPTSTMTPQQQRAFDRQQLDAAQADRDRAEQERRQAFIARQIADHQREGKASPRTQ